MDGHRPDFVRVENIEDLPDTPLAKRPDPVRLSWKSPGHPDTLVEVELKYPTMDDGSEMDLWAFQVGYIAEAERSRIPKVDEKTKMQSFPNEGCHEQFLRENLIVKPIWLKTEDGFKRFKQKAPPTVVAKLHMELRLAVGIDLDFSERLGKFTDPAAFSQLAAASESGSESPQSKSPSSSLTPDSPMSMSGAAPAPAKNA